MNPGPNAQSPRPILPELLAPGLDVIFVGAAPSLYAAERGHYYAGPRNRFWMLLHQAGFTPRQLREEEDSEVLRYGIGLTAIFPAIASSDNSTLPAATESDRENLRSRILHLSPAIVAYNGKDVFAMCTANKSARWGLQREMLGRSRQFVLPSSSGRADRWGAERLYFYRELKALIDSLKASSDR